MKIPAALRSGFAKALLESELSFGEEAGRLVCDRIPAMPWSMSCAGSDGLRQ